MLFMILMSYPINGIQLLDKELTISFVFLNDKIMTSYRLC